MADAAMADLDGNGNLDVVVGASDGMVYAIDALTGISLSGFPVTTGGAIWSSPAIADLELSGRALGELDLASPASQAVAGLLDHIL